MQPPFLVVAQWSPFLGWGLIEILCLISFCRKVSFCTELVLMRIDLLDISGNQKQKQILLIGSAESELGVENEGSAIQMAAEYNDYSLWYSKEYSRHSFGYKMAKLHSCGWRRAKRDKSCRNNSHWQATGTVWGNWRANLQDLTPHCILYIRALASGYYLLLQECFGQK